MAFLLFNTSGVVKKITRSSQKTGQVVPNLGLAEYLIRNKSADGDVLDDPTQNYIRCKLEDPEEKRLRGIHDLMRTARERVATSKDYLERTHGAVDRSFDKLRLFTQAPSGWLRDICTQPKELEGLTLSLEPMFTATTGQFENEEESADIVLQAAKPKCRADYREWAVQPTADNSTWKRKSYSKPILKNYHQCAAEVNDHELRTSSARNETENTPEKCSNDAKTSYDEDSTWNKAKTSYEDCTSKKMMTSYDELKEASEEKLLLQLCVDEFVIPPRLTVREIRLKDVSSISTESETNTCRKSPQVRETGILSLGSDRNRSRRASSLRRKSLDDQSSNGSHQHRPQPHRCLNRQCRSDCHLRRLLQQEEEEEDKQAEEQEGGGGGKGGGQQLHHQHHQKQQQEKVKSPEQQQRQHLQKNQQDKDKSQQRQQQQQQHQQKHHQEKDKSQQHHHHPHHQHKQEQHHQNHKQEKEKPPQQLHNEHHQTHQKEKEKSQPRHDQQQQHQHQHQHQQQQQQHKQEKEKFQQQQQHHKHHSKPDQQEKEKSQQQQQQNHHHQLQKQENEKPSHHHQLQDKKIVRVSSTASVPEQNEKRAFVKGQYTDTQKDELADFMLFIYREKEEPCAECLDSVEDERETNNDVGKHCESSRHTHQHQHRTMLRGTYQRKMKTTDKYIRWKFSCPVDLRNE